MTGERGTDPSLAGRTMLYRIADHEWDGELCELAGVPKELAAARLSFRCRPRKAH
jgi:sugar (pentulose or hexulose) kinase